MFSYLSLIYRGILLFDGGSVTLAAISKDLYLYEAVFPGTTSPKNTWGDYESSLECSNGGFAATFSMHQCFDSGVAKIMDEVEVLLVVHENEKLYV
jgi:hypothetical protein